MVPKLITPDYYAILGVDPMASLQDIKKSYHRLGRLCHPDKNHGKDTKEAFQLVSSGSSMRSKCSGLICFLAPECERDTDGSRTTPGI